jgi:hypothetical protein
MLTPREDVNVGLAAGEDITYDIVVGGIFGIAVPAAFHGAFAILGAGHKGHKGRGGKNQKFFHGKI